MSSVRASVRASERPSASQLEPRSFVDIAAGAFHTMAVANDGRLYTWGSGTDGQLGHGNNQSQLVPALVSTVVVRGVSNSSNR